MSEQFFQQQLDLEENRWYSLRAGELEMLIKRETDEWIEGVRHYPGESVFSTGIQGLSSFPTGLYEDFSEEYSWYRYLIGGEYHLELFPALPDRPLVLKPSVRRKILPGHKTKLLFFIPLWIQLYGVRKDVSHMVSEYPTAMLSSTWFGDIQGGDLSYALETGLQQEVKDFRHPTPFHAACFLNIQNSSNLLLDFFRMAVHVEYLSLFGDGEKLYTNEVNVNFTGIDQVSQVKYTSRGPRGIAALKKIVEPRQTASKSILKRSFSFIKQLSVM